MSVLAHWPAVAFVVGLIALWQIFVMIFQPSPLILPSPVDIGASLAQDWSIIVSAIPPTLNEIVQGFLLSVVFGVLLAMLITWSRIFEITVYPALIAAQIVPKVALAPLFLVWFGYGITSKVAVAFTIAVFPIIINSVVGLRSTDPQLLVLARSMGAGRWRTFRKITLINALPAIFGGFEIAITLAVIGVVVGEFINADNGLGYLVLVANGNLDTPLVFAVLLVLTVLGSLLFALLVVIKWLVIPAPLRATGQNR
ncbi:ABC transporter permease [Compostimonas suwonensis]|uniref:NitT/TauT family transport system permease protein n=1 Tax=Compostimonas suwonensis TaxID=1048394 RepID=A0A2M9C4A5_9MICO|nr:ABC transporter permease [Compostimonas suwonensis]PJJ65353.1 NitT/TauT family transport system permease protein [Compostimonas suwonensis]